MPLRLTRLFALALSCMLAAVVWADDVYWIDVRTAEEFGNGHVSGAINIPYEEIGARIGAVTEDRDAHIYLYCRSGRRSGIALDALRQAGYRNALNIGGFEEAMQAAARLDQCRETGGDDC